MTETIFTFKTETNLHRGITGYQTFRSLELQHKFLHPVPLHDQVPVEK